MIPVRPSRLIALPLAVFLLAAACRDGDQPSTAAGAQPPTRLASGPTVDIPAEAVIVRLSQPYAATAAGAGSITGTVTTVASLKPNNPEPTGADSPLCGESIPDQSVSQQGSGLGGVVVWLEGVRSGKPMPLERRFELESDKCRLSPRVQIAAVGGAVNVIGHDNFRQHLQFVAGGEREPRARIQLGRDEQVIPTELPVAAPGLVIVRDADHRWPIAYLAVFDHPYAALSAPNGSFTIDGVPPGSYTLVAWHERTKLLKQPVTVPAAGAAQLSLTLQPK